MKRKLIEDFLIDNTPMLDPDAGVNMTSEDIEEGATGMDESGVMHRMVLYADVKTWEFTYSTLTEEEFRYLRSLWKGKDMFQFTFTNDEGDRETVNAYIKSMRTCYWSKRHGLYKNMRFTILQC